VIGVPINAAHQYVGGFWNLLNPYALLGGIISLLAFITQGAAFLTLKISGSMADEARKISRRIFPFLLFAVMVFVVLSIVMVHFSFIATVLADGVVILLVLNAWLMRLKKDGWSFVIHSLAILFAVASLFMQLYPNVLVSNLNAAWNLTIYNSASSAYTLQTMSIIALILVPIVLAYQAWSYWLFKKRLTEKSRLEY
jgi:cytochrome d ubiquinol oxidase subunit II